MGSELVNFAPAPLLDGDRVSRAGVGVPEGLRGVAGGTGGAMVSSSALRSLESMVAAVFRSRAPPQAEQNRPFEETCAPQEEQYMGCEILSLPRADREPPRSPRRALGDAFHQHSRAVGQHFRDALHDFRGIVAHGDDGVRAMIAGVLQKQFVGVLARFFAKVRENGDVAA